MPSRKITIVLLGVLLIVVGGIRIWFSLLQNGGWVWLNNGWNAKTSLALFRETVRERPENSTAWRGLAHAEAAQGSEEAARTAWAHTATSAPEFVQYGINATVQQQYELAHKWFARAQAAQPAHGDAWYFAGTVYESQGQQEAAAAAYRQAARLILRRVALGDVQARLGRVLWSMGETEAAVRAYQAAEREGVFLQPFNEVLVLDGIGAWSLQSGTYSQAIQYLERATELWPEYGWAYFRLGRVYGLCCEDWKMAVATIKIGLTQDPGNKWGHLYLGEAYAELGDVAQAAMHYEIALELDPTWQLAQQHLAGLQEQEEE